MSAYPPLKTSEGFPIPADIAAKFLSQYLEQAKTTPYLLPNARLETSGPTAGSSSSSITIHNLQRVEAGLRGEWIAPKIDLEVGANVEVAKGMDDGITLEAVGFDKAEEGWMELEDYQREQSVEGPEQAQEELGVEDGDDTEENAKVDEDATEETRISKASKKKGEKVDRKPNKIQAPVDSVARKNAKKERLKAEKRAREEQRKAEA